MNFFSTPVCIYNNNTTRNTPQKLCVLFVQLFEVLESHPRVTILISFLNVFKCKFRSLGEVDEELRAPCKFIPKIFINFILLLGDFALFEEYFPKHIS